VLDLKLKNIKRQGEQAYSKRRRDCTAAVTPYAVRRYAGKYGRLFWYVWSRLMQKISLVIYNVLSSNINFL